MNSRCRSNALLYLLFVFFFYVKSAACGYDYVSDCATTLNVVRNGTVLGHQVSTCPYLTVFHGYDYGTVTSLNIAQAKSITWESCNNYVHNARLKYRIYRQGTSPGSFSSMDLPQVSMTTFGAYRTRYREKQLNLDLLAGLTSGSYFVELFFESEVSFNQNNTNVDDVIRKNNNGNFYRAAFTVNNGQTGALGVVATNQQNVRCNGTNSGSATVNATNGTAPISYAWSNGTAGATASNLAAGTYGVTATDAIGQTGTLNITITQPGLLLANISGTNTSSSTAANGSATAQPSGGTPPYSFLWSNGTTSATIGNLGPGSYAVTVTDANNCMAMSTVLVGVSGNIPTNYCAAKGDFPWLDWITSVKLNALDNPSGKSQYSNFTNLSTPLNKGTGYALTIQNSFSWQTYDEYLKVWIDYNRNGSFEEPGEVAFQGILTAPALGTPSALTTGTINIPSTAEEGQARMRVAIKRGAFPTPCETIPYGEVEDYTVILMSSGPVPCSLSASVANIQCNNNGTPANPTDDKYSFNLIVNGNGTGPGWSAIINAQTYNGAYGTPLTISGLNISAGAVGFTIRDAADANCSVTQNVIPPAPCSSTLPCAISATASAPVCHDNGTPLDPADDTYTFNLTVNGTNTGTGWRTTILGQLQSGPYSITTAMGPYPIVQGSQSITITDAETTGCSANLVINPPLPCSYGGGTVNYCASTSGFPWHDWIANVLFENIDNGSNKSPYSDFTGLSATVAKGNSYPISLTSGFSWYTYNEHWKVWIDFNHNGQFEEPAEVVFSKNEPTPPNGTLLHPVIGTINIPMSALEGTTRMRIAMKRSNAPMPCENLPFGEVEDYSISIVNNAADGGQFLVVDLDGTPGTEHIDVYAFIHTDQAGSHWSLEKSSDNLHFEKMLAGVVETKENLVVHGLDASPADGENHYRVSLFDKNGALLSRKYTAIPFEHVATFGLFPNPASQVASIQLSEMLGKTIRLEICNQLGQPVFRKMLPALEEPIFQIPVGEWRDGIYQVMIFPEGRRMVSRQLVVAK